MRSLASFLIVSGLWLAGAHGANAEPGSSFDGPGFASFIPADVHDFASARDLQARMTEGSVTSVQLVERALARINALDRQGPGLKAVVEINPEALSIASALDQERAEGLIRGPLHGLPVLLKDNIDTADLMQTSSGSLALVGQPAVEDAPVVQHLRRAGAVLLGKANTSELAGFRDGNIPSGWSGRGGQVRNPLGLGLPVCGSSAGPAAALAAGFAALSVGTETNGSIVCPAHANGVVGLRPTLGLLSQAGIVPLSSRQDTPGPMARTVADAALLLGAMRDADERVDYLAQLDVDALKGKRLGYLKQRRDGSLTTAHPHFMRLAPVLEAAGATLVPLPMVIPDLRNEQMAVLSHDFKRELDRYLQGRPGLQVQSLADVIAFNRDNPGPEGYGQQWLEQAQALVLDEQAYQHAADRLRARSQRLLEGATGKHALDALIDLVDGGLRGLGAQAGYPGLMVPAGLDDAGLPVGLYFSGLPDTEASLLALGYGFEQAQGSR